MAVEVNEPRLLVLASEIVHLVECFREAHLHSPQGDYGITSEMYNDLRDKAQRKLDQFNRKTWEQ